jgi:ferredoxin
MPKETKASDSSGSDIFQLLTASAEREKKKRREELLQPLSIMEFFVDGSLTINKRTCKGLECKLCIKACPTSALFWKRGEVGLTRDLCVYCGACVLNCIVDDCIRISRRRFDGKVETFSSPRSYFALQSKIDADKRLAKILEVFPTTEDYLGQVRKAKTKSRLKRKG